jgi:phospholipase A-2-activating protein
LIRVFDVSGKLRRSIKGATDVVRALCHVPLDHPSKADFASAGNDGLIRLWRLDGKQVGELQGHESYIYSLVSLPGGELVSSGEDRTVRIWRGSDCIQTITHPAISVWGVAACGQNGDIVSGASDRKVRIFSRAKERQAEPKAIQAFTDSVKSSSIPQQQVGDINKEKLPGPEFLQQKSGTKEGQVVMIQEHDGSVSAHQWSQGAQRWMNVGTVVDSVGSSGKKIDYLGKDYDYVFDVDIEDGKPPLKLPYNLSQNPYEAATKFIQDNELPITYLDQVANFITSNTIGTSIGQTSQPEPVGADPWGTESRYRPGETASAAPGSPARPKVLPQTTYLSIKTASLRTILKKISELNERLIDEGSEDLSLNPSQLSLLGSIAKPLEQALSSSTSSANTVAESVPIVLHIATAWPPADRLPGLDLLRLLTAASPATASYRTSAGESIIEALAASGVFDDQERPNNIMLAIRAFSNLFETSSGRDLADTNFEKLHGLIKPCASAKANRNLTIAITTLYLNFATLFTSPSYASLPSSIDRSLALIDDLAQISAAWPDSEAVYRALVAAGTLLGLSEEIRAAARQIYELEIAVSRAEARLKEPRVKGVVAEIKALLKEE